MDRYRDSRDEKLRHIQADEQLLATFKSKDEPDILEEIAKLKKKIQRIKRVRTKSSGGFVKLRNRLEKRQKLLEDLKKGKKLPKFMK